MAFSDLQSFVADLQRLDQLRQVKAEVDPILEITEIADRVMKSACPEGCLLYTSPSPRDSAVYLV
ncbi:MAG: UbiD family decarboxylase, partial [Phycisphaerae bacterium]|nr:UbiD family decarboxylase [Phycisphaerae bacterium]